MNGPERIAYSVPEAAAMTSMSERTLRSAIASHSLIARYPTSKPVILHSDLIAWLESCPSVPPSQRRSA